MPESETSSPAGFRNWCRQLAEKSRDWFTDSLTGLQEQFERSMAEVDRKIDEVLQENASLQQSNQELQAENQQLAARAQAAEAESQQLSELHSQIIALLREKCPEVWEAFDQLQKARPS